MKKIIHSSKLIVVFLLLLTLTGSSLYGQCLINAPSSINLNKTSAANTTYVSNFQLNCAGYIRYQLSVSGPEGIITNPYLEINSLAAVQNTLYHTNSNSTVGLIFQIPGSASVCSTQVITLKILDANYSIIDTKNISVTMLLQTNDNILVKGNRCFYTGSDERLHLMTYTPNPDLWTYSSITPIGGWGNVKIGSNLEGDVNSSVIYFRGTDEHLYGLNETPSGWNMIQLSTSAEQPTNICMSQRWNIVYYYSNSSTSIKTFSWDGNYVTKSDIIPLNGWQGGVPDSDVGLSEISTHIFYRTINNQLAYLVKSGKAWNSYLIPEAGNLETAEILCDYPTVYFRGTDKRIHNVTYQNSQWVYDPMVSVTAQTDWATQLVKEKNDGLYKVYYRGADKRIYNIWKQGNGQWRVDWLGPYNNAVSDLVAANGGIFFLTDFRTINLYYVYNNSWNLATVNQIGFQATGCSSMFRMGNTYVDETVIDTKEIDKQLNLTVNALYPNPIQTGTAQLNITLAKNSLVEVKIFNSIGQEIKHPIKQQLEQGEHNLSLSTDGMPSGIYLLSVQCENEQPIIQRIIIE